LQRRGASRPPEVGDKPASRKFERHPTGFLHIGPAEPRAAEGERRHSVAVDRTGRFVFARRASNAGKPPAASGP